jgi:hypothetical protein
MLSFSSLHPLSFSEILLSDKGKIRIATGHIGAKKMISNELLGVSLLPTSSRKRTHIQEYLTSAERCQEALLTSLHSQILPW